MAEPITIAYLYEDLMNTYGDSGDVKILRYWLNQKGFDVRVDNISLDAPFNAEDYDFVFFLVAAKIMNKLSWRVI